MADVAGAVLLVADSGSISRPSPRRAACATSSTVIGAARAEVDRVADGVLGLEREHDALRRCRETWMKSRDCSPSSKMTGGRPFSRREAKIAATPVYGFESAWPGPVDVEEAQGDGRDAVGGADDEAQLLVVALR